MIKQVKLGKNWTATIERNGNEYDVHVLKGSKVVDAFGTRGTRKQIIKMCKWSIKEYELKGSIE